MKQSAMMRLLVLSMVVAIVAGCSTNPRTYSQGGEAGATEPAAGEGLIKVSCDSETSHLVPSHNHTITIVSLDEKNFTSLASKLFLPNGPAVRDQGVDVVYVKPGQHNIGLHYRYLNTGTDYSALGVSFLAETGKSYIIRWKENDDGSFWRSRLPTVSAWVEEAETGKKVSSGN